MQDRDFGGFDDFRQLWWILQRALHTSEPGVAKAKLWQVLEHGITLECFLSECSGYFTTTLYEIESRTLQNQVLWVLRTWASTPKEVHFTSCI